MTIAEIERTLQSLYARHSNLNEELLITLLTAGGWEEKYIKDAVTIFKTSPELKVVNQRVATQAKETIIETKADDHPPTLTGGVLASEVKGVSVTENNSTAHNQSSQSGNDFVYYTGTGEEEKAISPELFQTPEQQKEFAHKITEADNVVVAEKIKENNLVEHVNSVSEQRNEVSSEEQVSLIPSQDVKVKIVAPPDNLPLKPFEGTPHIWSFGKYKEVFDGEHKEEVFLTNEEKTLVGQQKTPETSLTQATVKEDDRKQIIIKIKRSKFDGEDEGLIFLTATTLLIILLLLAYMYGNGRL